jgi:hypothetical protein
MKKCLFLLLAIVFLFLPKQTLAFENPLNSQNNSFGIHILDDSDMNDAATLVNSSGGDWGYVTLVIRKDERDIKRWQRTFDNMRKLHLIPIIRIASVQKNNGWEKIANEDIESWVFFLNSLNWVTKNRYLIIGNEVNHADEWGGEIKPDEYANILCNFYQQLNKASDDFFVIHAGFDASAPNDRLHMDEEKYLKEEIKIRSDLFSCFNGWSSHSYPNPNFAGLETASGRGTVKTYLWEEDLLKSLGKKQEIPIFITETGWAINPKNKLLTPEIIAKKLKYAFENIWKEKNIVAVTPFVIKYTEPPFNVFSWKDQSGIFYPVYGEIKNLPKTKGKPVQVEKGEIKFALIPKVSKSGTLVSSALVATNKGQSIWEPEATNIVIIPENGDSYHNAIFTQLEPGKTEIISFRLSIPDNSSIVRGKIFLESNEKKISSDYNFEILTIKPKAKNETIFSYIKNTLEAWITKKDNVVK